MRDGIVLRDSLERKMDSDLAPEEHLLVKKGDLAYNTMRMWQGAVGLVGEEGLVSPAYVVLRPRKTIDPLFAYHLFKVPRMIHKFLSYSYGITDDRLRLYFKDLAEITVDIPPIDEQRRIAERIDAWDRLIRLVNRRISRALALQNALMNTVLLGHRRPPSLIKCSLRRKDPLAPFPLDWPTVEIRQIAKEVIERANGEEVMPVLSCTKTRGLVSSQEYFGKQMHSSDTKAYKVVRSRQFAYATNHLEEGSIGYLESPECGLVSPMYTVFSITRDIDGRFLYRLFKTDLYRHIFWARTSTSVNRRGGIRWQEFSKIRVPVPTQEEQQWVIQLFADLDGEVSLLQKYATRLLDQKSEIANSLTSTVIPS
jgi:type I restriction enzyme S subunit